MMLLVGVSAHAQLNTDRITSIGRNALYFEDYVLSIQYFNQVIKLKPYLAEPYLLRAIAKIQLSDYSGALRDCNMSIECNPFQPGAYYTRGYVYRQLDELDLAEQDFTKALDFSPENKTYMLLRADVRAQKEQYDLAMADIDYLLRREPQSPSLNFEKGVICLHSQDTTCALNSFQTSVKYDSQNPGNWSALGLVQLMQDNRDEALASLTKCINLGSKWAGDYMNRGIIFYQNHNYRSALADYDKAVSMEPRNAQCYYNRGMLRAELGDYNRALDDLNQAVELAPYQVDMRYQRAMVLMQLRQWKQALEDFDALIERYPYFLPSYYLAAQAKTALGESKKAYQYRQTAYELEQKKDSIMAAMHDSINAPQTDVQIAKTTHQSKDRRKEFSARTAQNQAEQPEEKEYSSETRGSIQKRYTDVVNEPNIVLSYYAQNQPLRRTNYFHYIVEDFNRLRLLPSPLHFTLQEMTLTADMVNQHFEKISQLSAQIDVYEKQYTNATALINLTPDKASTLYLSRAIEFALVQDYFSALDDCTKALQLSKNNAKLSVLLTFCRANWRFKLLEYQRATGELTAEAAIDFEIMLRDYDYVNKLQPDFAFAYYNKANILCTQKEYQAAIEHYTKAIAADNEFAEAYFNRGLTRIYIDQVEEGIADLSHAGELGIYQAYNLITRFQ
ncbi:MAG: tetratricopeptide repeat protein [Paludibacteraceae bacterium]|nr:tetratricopeptide repeat protein [Paludibacteraceae bacterium]